MWAKVLLQKVTIAVEEFNKHESAIGRASHEVLAGIKRTGYFDV